MDYSLLIGIHDIDKALEERHESDDNLSPEDTEDTDDDQLNGFYKFYNNKIFHSLSLSLSSYSSNTTRKSNISSSLRPFW
jgi:hypothetical protein